MKLLPFTVNVNAALPATAVFGLIEVATGTGLLITTGLIVKFSKPLVPPPGPGVYTEIVAVPAVAILTAGITAVNCVELPKVVANAIPFQLMTEPFMNPVPVTVSVNAELPVTAEVGDIDMITGTGLLVVPPPPPPLVSDLLQEFINKKTNRKFSSFVGLIFGCFCRYNVTNIENL